MDQLCFFQTDLWKLASTENVQQSPDNIDISSYCYLFVIDQALLAFSSCWHLCKNLRKQNWNSSCSHSDARVNLSKFITMTCPVAHHGSKFWSRIRNGQNVFLMSACELTIGIFLNISSHCRTRYPWASGLDMTSDGSCGALSSDTSATGLTVLGEGWASARWVRSSHQSATAP